MCPSRKWEPRQSNVRVMSLMSDPRHSLAQKPSLKSRVSLSVSNALKLEDAVWERESIYRVASCRKSQANLNRAGIIIRHCHGCRKCCTWRTRLQIIMSGCHVAFVLSDVLDGE